VRCIDYLGHDESIVQAARCSYGTGTKNYSSTEGLINYLMRHWHTSVFEQCFIKFHMKLPISTARQLVRHRTAHLNEYSARYSVLDREFYVPDLDRLAVQSSNNKQGSGTLLDPEVAKQTRDMIGASSNSAFDVYNWLLGGAEEGQSEIPLDSPNLARELARDVLPVNTYTQWYWSIDLSNLFHFLRLRDDPHAQWEIRQYASTIAMLVERWVPLAYEAFLRYRKNAITFSEREVDALSSLFNSEEGAIALGDLQRQDVSQLEEFSKGEWQEFLAKLDRIKNDSAA
jgi:thymidylate synthase (FAD)